MPANQSSGEWNEHIRIPGYDLVRVIGQEVLVPLMSANEVEERMGILGYHWLGSICVVSNAGTLKDFYVFQALHRAALPLQQAREDSALWRLSYVTTFTQPYAVVMTTRRSLGLLARWNVGARQGGPEALADLRKDWLRREELPAVVVDRNESVMIGRRLGNAFNEELTASPATSIDHCRVRVFDDGVVSLTDYSTNGTYVWTPKPQF